MRRIGNCVWRGLVAWLLVTSSNLALADVQISEQGDQDVYSIKVDDVKFDTVNQNGDVYYQPRLVGVDRHQGITYKPGHPQLPVVRFFVTGKPEIRINKRVSTVESIRYKIYPSQRSLLKVPDVARRFTLNKDIYQSNDLIPAQPYTIQSAGSIRGVERKMVTLYPVQYSPRTGRVQINRDFKVIVENQGLNIDNDKETFAFVVGEDFASSAALSRYVRFKQDMGYDTRVLIVGQDVNTSDDIRQALKTIYADASANLKYALIIGDAEDVPGHESSIISGVTDHYYRAIDTDNYEEDINGPDIGVGRISVQTEEQLQAVVEKYIAYSQGAFQQQNWLDSVAFIATDDRWEVAEGTHNYAIQTYTAPQGYVGMFPEENLSGGDQLYAITHRVSDAKVVETMQNGRTIINYSGHGGTTSWAGPNVSQSDVRSLGNDSALPFVISNACITGNFRIPESFGETWQRHRYGAIMFWGSMDNTYWDEDDILERAMYDRIYRDGKLEFKDITQYALGEMWRAYGGEGKSKYYWETYVSFGDPSIQLRTAKVRQLNVNGLGAVPLGLSQVEYILTDASTGAPVADARVSLANASKALVEYTDASGKVVFNISQMAGQPGDLRLTASAPNSALHNQTVNVFPANAPFLSAEQIAFNQRQTNGIHVGEDVEVSFRMTNIGRQPTSGGTLKATLERGPVTLTTDEITFGSIGANQSLDIDDAFSFVVNANARAKESVIVRLDWETNEGATSNFRVLGSVLRGEISFVSADFGLNNPEGGIEPGQSGQVWITIRNDGNETIPTGTFSLRPKQCADVVAGSSVESNIRPEETRRIAVPFQIVVSDSCRAADAVVFDVVGEYDSLASTLSVGAEGTFTAGIESTANVSVQPGLAVPDVGEPVEAEIAITRNGQLTDLAVTVAITHTYIGDLSVTLVHPDGTEVTLHERTGGGADNLNKVYGMGGEALEALASLKGKSTAGSWKLRVQDHATGDTGTVDTFGLTIKGYLQ